MLRKFYYIRLVRYKTKQHAPIKVADVHDVRAECPELHEAAEAAPNYAKHVKAAIYARDQYSVVSVYAGNQIGPNLYWQLNVHADAGWRGT